MAGRSQPRQQASQKGLGTAGEMAGHRVQPKKELEIAPGYKPMPCWLFPHQQQTTEHTNPWPRAEGNMAGTDACQKQRLKIAPELA